MDASYPWLYSTSVPFQPAGFSILKFAFSPEASVVWPVHSTTVVPLQVIVVAADAPAGRRANPSPRIEPAQSRRSHLVGVITPLPSNPMRPVAKDVSTCR
jgi:hypothetical protein